MKTLIWIVLFFLIIISTMLLSCDEGNDDEDEGSESDSDTSDDDSEPWDDDGADDDTASDDDDNDDNTTDDDDNDDIDITATVTIEPAPAGNPLARKIIVQTDIECSLSGRVTTYGESGYGPSAPLVSEKGTTHEFWFYGLLESRQFDYKFYLEGTKNQVVADGSFNTSSLPVDRPIPISIEYDLSSGPSDWYMVYHAKDLRHVLIYDRKGRIRFFHVSDIGQFNQVLDNGDIVGTKHSELRAVKLDGTEYTLFDVSLNAPVHRNTHHKFYVPSADADWAVVVYARKGMGVECDLETPTDQAVGDGIAEIDEFGNEVWRFDVFDHQAEVPPEDVDPDMCLYEFWGPGTIDFTHGNSVIPVPGENAYLLSYRNVSRVLKIDRGSGNIVWQMGQNLDFTWIGSEPAEEQFFLLQHDPHILANGNYMIYDNNKGQSWSRAIELAVDENAMTVQKVWEYRTPHHTCEGNVQQHENGHILLSTGSSNDPMVIEMPYQGVTGEEYFEMRFENGIVRTEYYPALWEGDGGTTNQDDDDDGKTGNSDDDDGQVDGQDDSSSRACG